MMNERAAGFGDTISGGLTQKIRAAAGYDYVVDKSSAAYAIGGYSGVAMNIALTAVTPVGWAGVEI